MLLITSSADLTPPLSYRVRNSADSAFLETLFFASKRDKFASAIGPEMLNIVLDQQYSAQRQGYTNQFPNATDYVILHNALPIGRFMLNLDRETILLVDIGIMPSMQKQGVGKKIMHMLIKQAEYQNLKMELSVAADNLVAFRLYAKLGFKPVSEYGHHIKMRYRPN